MNRSLHTKRTAVIVKLSAAQDAQATAVAKAVYEAKRAAGVLHTQKMVELKNVATDAERKVEGLRHELNSTEAYIDGLNDEKNLMVGVCEELRARCQRDITGVNDANKCRLKELATTTAKDKTRALEETTKAKELALAAATEAHSILLEEQKAALSADAAGDMARALEETSKAKTQKPKP